jgi:hypothetical protein
MVPLASSFALNSAIFGIPLNTSQNIGLIVGFLASVKTLRIFHVTTRLGSVEIGPMIHFSYDVDRAALDI